MLAHIITCNMWLANRSLMEIINLSRPSLTFFFKEKHSRTFGLKYVPLEYIFVIITNSLFCYLFVIGYEPTVLKSKGS